MPSLIEILAMPNSEVEHLYKEVAQRKQAEGRKDIKFAVNSAVSVTDVMRAQLAIYACHNEALTRPIQDI